MNKTDHVNKLIEEAKESYAKMGKTNVPGAQYLAMEGVDQIPLGGDSNANSEEDLEKEELQ